MVSELGYSQLEHVVINNDFEFCLRDMSRQGGSWLFCYLIGTSTALITVQYYNKSSTNNEGFPWRQYFHTLGFQLLPIFFMVLACEMSLTLGGELNMTWFNI